MISVMNLLIEYMLLLHYCSWIAQLGFMLRLLLYLRLSTAELYSLVWGLELFLAIKDLLIGLMDPIRRS